MLQANRLLSVSLVGIACMMIFTGRGAVAASGEATTQATTLATAPADEKKTDADQMAELWKQLAGKDNKKVNTAVSKLVAKGDKAVSFLTAKFKTTATDKKLIAKLIVDLDANKWAVRAKAHEELQRLSLAAVPMLSEAIKTSKSEEVKARASVIMAGAGRMYDSSARILALICSKRSVKALNKLLAAAPLDMRRRANAAVHKVAVKYWETGRSYFWNNRYDEAIGTFNKVLILRPKSKHVYRYRGLAYKGKKQYEKAMADFTRAIKIDPKYAAAYNNRGNIYQDKRQYDKAIAEYNKAIESNPKNTNYYVGRGMAHANKKQYDKAIADYIKAIEIDSENADAYINRGIAYRETKQYDKALADYTKAIELAPEYVIPYYGRGNIYYYKGRYDKAIANYNKAIEINPKYAAAYSNRGNAYYYKGRYDKAITDYNKAIEIDPNNAHFYLSRGITYAKKKQYDKAIIDYNKAIDIDPEYAIAYLKRGVVYQKTKQYDEAIADYNKVIEINPKNAAAYSKRGLVLFQTAQFQSAADDFAKVLKLPNKNKLHTAILLYLARMRSGKEGAKELAAFAQKEAEKKLRKWPAPVIQMYLKKITPQQCLAAAKSKDRKKDRKQKCEAFFHIGQYYFLKAQNDKAAEYFRKCIATKETNSVEYVAAQIELDRLKKLKK